MKNSDTMIFVYGLALSLLSQSAIAAETVTLVAGEHTVSLPAGKTDKRQGGWQYGTTNTGRSMLKQCKKASQNTAQCKHNYNGPEHGCGSFNDVTLTLHPNGKLEMIDKRCYGFSLTKDGNGTWSGTAEWGGPYTGLSL